MKLIANIRKNLICKEKAEKKKNIEIFIGYF
jgi:hypothetical protein